MKKAIFIVIVIVLLLIINSLVRSIFDLTTKRDLLTKAQKELEVEKVKNQKLKAELTFVKTEQFIEETAHNKLFLVKPGEQQVLISKDLILKTQDQNKKENLPNWQKWFNLFF